MLPMSNLNYPSHNPNNPNLFTPIPTNPVVITYPSQRVYEKINNSINLLGNAVQIAYKRGVTVFQVLTGENWNICIKRFIQ